MRIITGTLKGRRLTVPNSGVIRPTSDFTKGGIFNMIEARKGIEGERIIDLFAGTGNLGFEAVSRGAVSVISVEMDRGATKAIERTAEQFGVADKVTVICSTVESFLSRRAVPCNIVFADPPYDYPDMLGLVERVLSAWLEPDGWLILEHDVRHIFTDHPKCVFAKPYGKTIVSIFKLS
jgi:16S rRNA (guanine966-N2)-methyltransferase